MIYKPQQLYRLLLKAALISTLFILLVAWTGIAVDTLGMKHSFMPS